MFYLLVHPYPIDYPPVWTTIRITIIIIQVVGMFNQIIKVDLVDHTIHLISLNFPLVLPHQTNPRLYLQHVSLKRPLVSLQTIQVVLCK
jgi:hypothetical protein